MKPYIFIITIFLTLGLISCNSDDHFTPEPPTPENPLIGKWSLKKVKVQASFGQDLEKEFESGEFSLIFHLNPSNSVEIKIESEDEGFYQYPNLTYIYPFYEQGIFNYFENETHDSLTFNLDYWPIPHGGPVYKNEYRIQNDTLYIGKLYALAYDGHTREMAFVREN